MQRLHTRAPRQDETVRRASSGQPHVQRATTYSLADVAYGNKPLPSPLLNRQSPVNHDTNNRWYEPQRATTYSETNNGNPANPRSTVRSQLRPQVDNSDSESDKDKPQELASRRKPKSKFFSDLVRDSKIETTVTDAYTQHISYVSGRSARERRVRQEERWVRETRLGQGAFGIVYRERRLYEGSPEIILRRMRAVKEIKKYVVEGEALDYTRELEAVMKFSHAKYSHCFVRSDGWYEHGDSIFIAMEYLELGDLQRHLTRPLPENQARDIISQVLEGLGYMHENSFVHRDLKPGNIMVVATAPDWFVKIADFGISKRRHQEMTTMNTMQRGTFGYAAPEAIGFEVDHSDKNESSAFAVDMWSLGAVMYRILTNTSCFQNLGQLARYASRVGPFPMQALEERKASESSREFMTGLMNPTPEDRLTAVAAMAHPWMEAPLDEVTHQISQTNLDDPGPSTGLSAPSAVWSEEDPTIKQPPEDFQNPKLGNLSCAVY